MASHSSRVRTENAKAKIGCEKMISLRVTMNTSKPIPKHISTSLCGEPEVFSWIISSIPEVPLLCWPLPRRGISNWFYLCAICWHRSILNGLISHHVIRVEDYVYTEREWTHFCGPYHPRKMSTFCSNQPKSTYAQCCSGRVEEYFGLFPKWADQKMLSISDYLAIMASSDWKMDREIDRQTEREIDR